MATTGKPGAGEIDEAPGIAGGPGPTPPGVEDGTTTPRRAKPEVPLTSEEQRREGEVAEREAGARRAGVPSLAGQREGRGAEGDPAIPNPEQERLTRR